jgi:hypothetical protein
MSTLVDRIESNEPVIRVSNDNGKSFGELIKLSANATSECEQRTISKYCICKECIKQKKSFDNYKQSFAAKTVKYLK